MEWASAISERPLLGDAAAEAGDVLLAALGGPADLVLAFVGAHHASSWRSLPSRLRFVGGTLLGASAGGVIGGGREVERGPCLALVGARLPGVRVHPFHAEDEVSVGVAPEELPVFLLLPDPFTCAVESLLGAMDAAWPTSVKLGGLAGGGRAPGQNVLFCGEDTHTRGAAGVALVGDIAMDTVVSQGCRPFGRPLHVTRSRAHLLFELDGRAAIDVLEEAFAALGPPDQARFRGSPMVGIALDGAHPCRGEYLVRTLLGIDRRAGAVGVGWPLEEGAVVQFHLRDPAASAGELDELLGRQSPRGTASAALLFSCLGRGEGFYGRPDHDSDILRRRLGPLPIGGFFCNGEIGPVHGRTCVHGHTSVIGLARARGWD